MELISQQELAEKYHCDQGTVSLALSMAGVFRKNAKNAIAKGHVRYQYEEREAAGALQRLFRKRAENYRAEAEKLETKARRVEVIYEESKDQEKG